MLDQEHINMLRSILPPEKLADLVNLYIKDSARLIDACKEDLQSNNLTSLRENAHSLKGSSGNMGVTHLFEGAKKLEDAAKAQDDAGIPTLLNAIDESYPKVKEALMALIH
jgi:HPt (histidine-containing phosphotransfer) domain-containing protein